MLEDTNGFVYTDVDGTSIELNTLVYPFSKTLNIELEQPRTASRPKNQDHGMWPTFDWLSGMTIDVEGDIFSDTSDNYHLARMALVQRLRYRPAAPRRRAGSLLIDFAGSTEVWTTDVRIDAFSAPKTLNSDDGPARTPFMITFYSFTPYFTGVDSGDFYYYS